MTKLKVFSSIALLAIIFATTNAFSQTYTISSSKSWLGWEGKKVTGKHNGTITIKSGVFANNNGKFTGNFVIDMNSIVNEDLKDATYNAKLVGHLKSDDFFAVSKFPTATLDITKIEPYTDQWGATHLVYGKLTIKGTTNEITFPSKITFNGNDMQASAEFSIDRSKWFIKYGSGSFFDDLGDKVIYDNIKFNVNLVGSK
jgi:polyisoprenoid-binding protein YceI